MANEIQIKEGAATSLTITLASLAASAARQSTTVDNSTLQIPAALIFVKITSGAVAPTAGQVYEIYLLRSNGTIADDNAGASDAGITIENAPIIGTIVVTATTAKAFYGVFDTSTLGILGPTWAIAVKNGTDQTINATGGNHVISYISYIPEVQ